MEAGGLVCVENCCRGGIKWVAFVGASLGGLREGLEGLVRLLEVDWGGIWPNIVKG